MNVSFRDMLFLLVFAYLVVGALALANVHKKVEENQNSMKPPGSVIVELHWDDKIDADIDLWVEAPGDVPVGYSNKTGTDFSLLKDDLGHSSDPYSMNYEVAYGQGILTDGEYIVDTMFYRSADNKMPVTGWVKVSIRNKTGDTKQVLQTNIKLTFVGQEITVFRFKLDKDGHIVPGSLNSVPADLRTKWLHTPSASTGSNQQGPEATSPQ